MVPSGRNQCLRESARLVSLVIRSIEQLDVRIRRELDLCRRHQRTGDCPPTFAILSTDARDMTSDTNNSDAPRPKSQRSRVKPALEWLGVVWLLAVVLAYAFGSPFADLRLREHWRIYAAAITRQAP